MNVSLQTGSTDGDAHLEKRELLRVTSQEAKSHGLFAGLTDSLFTSLLAYSAAPAMLYAVLTHASSLISILAYAQGLRRCQSNLIPQRDLGLCCLGQGVFLFVLLVALLLFPASNILAWMTCAISVVITFVGTFASPSWHASWANTYAGEQRKELVQKRSLLLNLSMFIAVVLGALIFLVLRETFAFVAVLGMASLAKFYSGFCILRAKHFPRFLNQEKSQQHFPLRNYRSHPVLLALCFLYFGLGVSLAFYVPYFLHYGGGKTQDVFFMGLAQLLGSILIFAGICLRPKLSEDRILLPFAIGLLVCMPLVCVFAYGQLAWIALALSNGIALGCLGLFTQQYVQSHEHLKEVASFFSALCIAATIAQVLGGICGVLIFKLLPHYGAYAYMTVFLLSSCIRLLAYPLLLASLGGEEQDAASLPLHWQTQTFE